MGYHPNRTRMLEDNITGNKDTKEGHAFSWDIIDDFIGEVLFVV